MIQIVDKIVGEQFCGVTVKYYERDMDTPDHVVDVSSDYAPLAIELLEHAIVALKART